MKSIEQAWLDYRQQLLVFIQHRVASADDAEDILSQVFEKLIQAAAKQEPPTHLGGWLYQVSRHAIIDHYRQLKPMDSLPDDWGVEQDEPTVIKQLSHCLLPLIQTIPEPYQVAVRMADIDELNHQQIADQLGISLSAAKSRVRRGREKLHQSVVQCCLLIRDNEGKLLDFEQKTSKHCVRCD